ncbi:MAG: hypothetical protein ABIF08_02630 [Nanoarchaeota archaeon]
MISQKLFCKKCKKFHTPAEQRRCDILSNYMIQPKDLKLTKDVFGPTYSVFVGSYGYPNVFVGPMIGMERNPIMDKPSSWFGMDYGEIIKLRGGLIRSKNDQNIFSKSKFVSDMQDLAMANTTDVEMSFKKKPFYRISFSQYVQPMGPSGDIEKMKIAENPKIPKKVDCIVSDDLKAAEASFRLYKTGQDVYKVSTILSSGVMGMEKNKKLVPTRYSITAVDDIIAKELMKKIREYPQLNEYLVYESYFLDNHFIILMCPGNWEYENFEAWTPDSQWYGQKKDWGILQEYESFKGRTKYAESEAGGYYAARIAVTEALDSMRKQSRVVVFREIHEGYNIPLGVWQVRENVRNAMKQRPKKFNTSQEALEYVKPKLKISINNYIKISKILSQSRIDSFLNL